MKNINTINFKIYILVLKFGTRVKMCMKTKTTYYQITVLTE